MINCPKCQVPNPDTAPVCAACGSTLAGQQLAQALDQAAQQQGAAAPPPPPSPGGPAAPPAPASGAGPGAPVPPGPGPGAQPADPLQGFPAPLPAPMPMMDPGQAQAEINRFMAEQRARRRTKSMIYLAILLVLVGIAGFLMWQSSRKKARIEQVARFFDAFRKVDDAEVAEFWKCTVRAKHQDVRLAADTLEITEGLDKAFRNFPKTQPSWLLDKCVPRIPAVLEELGKLESPEGFAEPLEEVKEALKEVKTVFERYAAKIDQRKQEAADEQEIREAHAQFHNIFSEGGMASEKDAPKALAYYNLLSCAIPDLAKMVKGISKPPETQPMVEYIYNTCKGDSKYADKLRKECFARRNDNYKRTPDFRAAANKMAGDDRDLSAIDDCFRRANVGFSVEEIKAVAEVFIKYRNARGKIMEQVGKVKEEMAD